MSLVCPSADGTRPYKPSRSWNDSPLHSRKPHASEAFSCYHCFEEALYPVVYDDGTGELRRSITRCFDGHPMVALHQSAKPAVIVSRDLDWLLTKAPEAVVTGAFRGLAVPV